MEERNAINKKWNYEPDMDVFPNGYNHYGNTDYGHNLAEAITRFRGGLERTSRVKSRQRLVDENKVRIETRNSNFGGSDFSEHQKMELIQIPSIKEALNSKGFSYGRNQNN